MNPAAETTGISNYTGSDTDLLLSMVANHSQIRLPLPG